MSDDGLRDDPEPPGELELICPGCEGPIESCVCEDEDFARGGKWEMSERQDLPRRNSGDSSPPMRVQIASYGVLRAEVIVEFCMVDPFSPHHVWARLGGVVIQRADLPRTWDVPVGSQIRPVAPDVRRKAS